HTRCILPRLAQVVGDRHQDCDSFGFCIWSVSSQGKRCRIELRHDTIVSSIRRSRSFHRSQYCASTAMAGWMASALEGPVESKRIASGALIAREIHSVAILCEG